MILLSLLLATVTDSVVIRDIPVAPGEVLRVTIAGTGRPAILVPGLLGSAFAFRKIIAPLRDEGFQVVVIEPLGVGWSSRPARSDYSLTAQADRIGIVLDTLGLRGATVMGHAAAVSMVLRLAVRRPDLVSGVLAVTGGPAETASTGSLRQAARFAFLLKVFGGRGMMRNQLVKGLRETSADPSWVTDQVVDGYAEGPGSDLDAALGAIKGMARSKEPDSLAPRLREIQVPVHLMVGGVPQGRGIGGQSIALMDERVADIVVDTVPGAGSHLHEERPDAVVRAFLNLANGQR
jgi:pimeloyl-ACP methyl ester carboxylesterase